MYYLLPASDLRVGMYVISIGISWLEHDTLYSIEGLIRDADHLDTVISGGYSKAYIDLASSDKNCLPPGIIDMVEGGWALPFADTINEPSASFQKEIFVAKDIYSASISRGKELMDGLRTGKIAASPAEPEPLVEEIIDSLDRNTDALFGLSKLRQIDEYTYTHCINVSVLAIMFARSLGAPRAVQEEIGTGALFHDLGKARISSVIVNAPRKLTPEESLIMRQHPSFGHDILIEAGNIPKVIMQMVLEHHEKLDGTGYPNGLKGSEISTAATIVGIVDVFDALTSKRVYKAPIPMHQVLAMLYALRGSEFPKLMIDRFIHLLGVYPLGTPVALNDGRMGVVAQTSHKNSLRPKVLIIKDNKGRSIMQLEVDLALEQSLAIKKAIPVEQLGIDPSKVLGLPTR